MYLKKFSCSQALPQLACLQFWHSNCTGVLQAATPGFQLVPWLSVQHDKAEPHSPLPPCELPPSECGYGCRGVRVPWGTSRLHVQPFRHETTGPQRTFGSIAPRYHTLQPHPILLPFLPLASSHPQCPSLLRSGSHFPQLCSSPCSDTVLPPVLGILWAKQVSLNSVDP